MNHLIDPLGPLYAEIAATAPKTRIPVKDAPDAVRADAASERKLLAFELRDIVTALGDGRPRSVCQLRLMAIIERLEK